MDNQKPQGSPFSNLSGGFSFDEQASFSFPDITFPTINAGFGPAGHPLNPVQPSPVVQQPATPIAKSHANATTKFKVGQIVKLTGLISSPELNGKVGEIVGLPDPKTSPDRYGVELFNTKQRIKAKPINLLDIFWDYRDSDSEDLSSEVPPEKN